MAVSHESLSKAACNEKGTAEAFQALESLRRLALYKGFTGIVAVELEVVDGVITHVIETYRRSVS